MPLGHCISGPASPFEGEAPRAEAAPPGVSRRPRIKARDRSPPFFVLSPSSTNVRRPAGMNDGGSDNELASGEAAEGVPLRFRDPGFHLKAANLEIELLPTFLSLLIVLSLLILISLLIPWWVFVLYYRLLILIL